jgi:hypothetical protein
MPTHNRRGAGVQGDVLIHINPTTQTSTTIKTILLTSKTVNILRVDQNWGGSRSHVRYALVTIAKISNKKLLPQKLILFIHDLLPPTILSDTDAKKYAHSRGY